MSPSLGESDETMRCPRCKKIAVKLISLNTNGSSKKYCRTCKRKILKKVKNTKFTILNKDGGTNKMVADKKTKVKAKPIGQLSDKTAWIALSEKRLKQLGFTLDNTTKEVRESVFKKLGIK